MSPAKSWASLLFGAGFTHEAKAVPKGWKDPFGV